VLIRMFLDGESFDGDAIDQMTAALAGACRSLGMKVKDDPPTRLLASKIIERARQGERNAERLRAAALEDFRK